MSDLNWNLRDILHQFKDSRLHVFMSIYLHKNTRNRSWPSNELIATETGLSSAPISSAIQWLIESHVVLLVPFDKRVGLELRLPNRKNIYQLTGAVLIEGQYYPYMNLTPEGWQSIAADLELLGHSLLSKQWNAFHGLDSKRLESKRKGIKEIALDSEGNKGESAPKGAPPVSNTSIHPLIQTWASIRGIDCVNIGAPVFTSKDVTLAKKMAKWPTEPTEDEIRQAIKSSKAKEYAFRFLEEDIPKLRLASKAAQPESPDLPRHLRNRPPELMGITHLNGEELHFADDPPPKPAPEVKTGKLTGDDVSPELRAMGITEIWR